ncbi:MAG: hypothetical protein A2289_10115 [Deltaproteobacteria bacterium RIFOXYA12_FULL_58_15]|nr:MAG: hypothetical protein A2289_10115 [Deltaproteobacteria bacterium RIFOXYA12_FULL_58_15]OGR08180.1 MAG: hypothetical protein A2341_20160 [Deltaproteobacteria bacterium RIFOXYB12_FULL_58_9]
MDIGAVIKAPTADKDWIKKILLIGVFMLIPIAGAFNALGYIKACYERRKEGNAILPDANLSYMGAGWWIFVAILPVIGVIVVLAILFQVMGFVMFKIAPRLGGIVAFVGMLALIAASLAAWAAMPAILYLHFAKGERWAGAKFGQILEIINSNLNNYLMFLLTYFVAGIIGGAGQIACGIGMLFTMPFCCAMQGAAIADFEEELTGGSSTAVSPAS